MGVWSSIKVMNLSGVWSQGAEASALCDQLPLHVFGNLPTKFASLSRLACIQITVSCTNIADLSLQPGAGLILSGR